MPIPRAKLSLLYAATSLSFVAAGKIQYAVKPAAITGMPRSISREKPPWTAMDFYTVARVF